MTPTDELIAAAARMRRHSGPAAEPIAALLDAAALLATNYPDLARNHDRATCDDYACDIMGAAITAARAILGGEQP